MCVVSLEMFMYGDDGRKDNCSALFTLYYLRLGLLLFRHFACECGGGHEYVCMCVCVFVSLAMVTATLCSALLFKA